MNENKIEIKKATGWLEELFENCKYSREYWIKNTPWYQKIIESIFSKQRRYYYFGWRKKK